MYNKLYKIHQLLGDDIYYLCDNIFPERLEKDINILYTEFYPGIDKYQVFSYNGKDIIDEGYCNYIIIQYLRNKEFFNRVNLNTEEKYIKQNLNNAFSKHINNNNDDMFFLNFLNKSTKTTYYL